MPSSLENKWGIKGSRMISPIHSRSGATLLPLLFLAACSSPPAQLYLLSSTVAPSPHQTAAQPDLAGHGSSRPVGGAMPADAPRVGVNVSVPDYADHTHMVERTSANELKPLYDAQWAENPAVTATRTLTEDLTALLPSDDVLMLPSRSGRGLEYEVRLDLTRFESDARGASVLRGRWSILDSEGKERARGRVARSEQVGEGGYEEMAAAMSRNLAAVSADIAAALERLSAQSPPRSTPAAKARR